MNNYPKFPISRPRRLRYNSQLREMVSEASLNLNDFVMPLFVRPGEGLEVPIRSMPGMFQFSIDRLVQKCTVLFSKGIKSVLLFGIPETKDADGSVACAEDGIVQNAMRAIKKSIPDMFLIADVCNCEYTSHGHCGPIVDGDVDNDATLNLLARQSVSLCKSGADMIAPSDMMDGRVEAIRRALDESGFYKIPIMSYAAKFSSAFYGPFREAAESTPQFGDRKTYQMDFRNGDEALKEMALDLQEGADVLMVKPGLSYLDILARAKDAFNIPLAVYNVSGEYSMIKAAAANGWIDEDRIVLETMHAFKRAGANVIITYFAEKISDLLKKEKD